MRYTLKVPMTRSHRCGDANHHDRSPLFLLSHVCLWKLATFLIATVVLMGALFNYHPVGVNAVIVGDASIAYCEKTGTSASDITCSKKLVVTLTIEGGQLPGVEELTFTNATDSTNTIGSSGSFLTNSTSSVVEFNPIRVTLEKTDTLMRYPVFYLHNFNVEPYELQIITTLTSQCSASASSSSPTCGRSYDSSGKAVPYSEGFCCNCGFCDLLGLCSSDSRAKLSCSVFNDVGSASCLRYGTRWYSGYTIGSSLLWYLVRVYLTKDSADSAHTTWTMLELSYSSKTAVSQSFGAQATLVGDYVSPETPLVLTSKVLFVPSMPVTDPRRYVGAYEWMLVDNTDLTLDGLGCNKIGINDEGFYQQPERCKMKKGTCLSGQLENKRTSDMTIMAEGKRGQYMVKNFGEFVVFNEDNYPPQFNSPGATIVGSSIRETSTDAVWSLARSSPATSATNLERALTILDHLVSTESAELHEWDGTTSQFLSRVSGRMQRRLGMDNESFNAFLSGSLDALRYEIIAAKRQREVKGVSLQRRKKAASRGSPVSNVAGVSLSTASTSSSAGSESPDVAYKVTTPGNTVITLVISADSFVYTAAVSTGVIVSANLTLTSVAASSRDGVLIVNITNTGTIASNYGITVTNCTKGTFPISQQVKSLRPNANGTAAFNVFFQDVSITATTVAHCTVSLLDMRGIVIDVKTVEWNVTVVYFNNGAQGGDGNTTGVTETKNASGSNCGSCPFYNPMCFVKLKCVWQVVVQILTVLIIVAVVFLVIYFRRPIFAILSSLFSCCKGVSRGYKSTQNNRRAHYDDTDGSVVEGKRNASASPAQPIVIALTPGNSVVSHAFTDDYPSSTNPRWGYSKVNDPYSPAQSTTPRAYHHDPFSDDISVSPRQDDYYNDAKKENSARSPARMG